MTTAVLDTNVFLHALIGRPNSAAARTLKAADANRFQLILCPSTIDELLEVLALPQMHELHGLTDEQVLRFVMSLLPGALLLPDPPRPPHGIARDITDSKFLGLAAAARANFLVTNDRRDLLRIGTYDDIPIVTPAAFLRRLT